MEIRHSAVRTGYAARKTVYTALGEEFRKRGYSSRQSKSGDFDFGFDCTASPRAIRNCARLAAMPTHKLSQLWEEHTKHEFETRDTEATLATMVEDAYVNHIPTLTGGYGKQALRQFYSRDFIPSMPPDTKLSPISRTVGENRIVDEMIFSFTHTQEMPWMLPGIAPTNRHVEVPLVAIVQFRDGKLAHEHIYWDQASVLKQIGLIEATNLPVFGAESARKVVDPQFHPKAVGIG